MLTLDLHWKTMPQRDHLDKGSTSAAFKYLQLYKVWLCSAENLTAHTSSA